MVQFGRQEENNNGQLGDGSILDSSHPVQVEISGGVVLNNVVSDGAGSYCAVYLKSDGTVWATGANQDGQLWRRHNS